MTSHILALSSALLGSLQSPAAADTTTPHVRAHHAIAYHPIERRVLLTSGSSPLDSGGSRYFMGDDTWRFDGHRWTLVSHSDRAMSGVRLAWDSRRQRMLSFGGYLGSAGSIGDLRVLEHGRWRTLEVLAEMPVAESGFVYDARRDRLVVFGGGSAHPDTWQHDGTAWSRVQGSNPPPRQAHVMVFDERRGRTVMFGGMGSAPRGTRPPALGDTWEFDGTQWVQLHVQGPGLRHGAGATYDAQRGLVLMFGGHDGTQMRNDLWAFDGTSWRLLFEGGPSPRAMGALAYDAARDRVVLFGGRRGWPDDLNDTWEWDGSAWHEVRR